MHQMPHGDRLPGPQAIHEVSRSARERWHEPADKLMDQVAYRPATLNGIASLLDAATDEEPQR